MSTQIAPDDAQIEELSRDLLAVVEKIFGHHAGFRPLHAKGIMCKGEFVPAAAAAKLTCAPHIVERSTTPVTVRFSNSTGLPLIPDADPNAGPRGFAIRFHLADHVHTDIVAHSAQTFPTRTGEEFLEFLNALSASGPDVASPKPIEKFLGAHPEAARYVQSPKPVPVSYATESYFGVTAMKFINAEQKERFGRFQIRPVSGNQYLSQDAVGAKDPNFLSEELTGRLAKGPAKFAITVQMAAPEDDVANATIVWPAERESIELGEFTLSEILDGEEPENKKIIFDPIPRVKGIDPSPDPLLKLRAAIYLISGRRRRAEN